MKPLYDELNAIKFRKKREAFYAEHESELKLFYLAKRKLDAVSPDHKFPVSAWKKELKELEATYKKEAEKLKPIREELKELYKIKAITENYIIIISVILFYTFLYTACGWGCQKLNILCYY